MVDGHDVGGRPTGKDAESAPDHSRDVAMPRILMGCITVILALDMALYAAIAPLLPSLREELGLSGGQIGLLMAAYPIGLVVAALPAGQLASRFGPRWATIFGAVVLAGASALFGLNEAYVLLVTLRLVQGAAAALTWAGGLAWITAAAPESRHGTLIGVAMSASVAGGVLGPVLGAVAVGTTRSLLFVVLGAVSALAAAGLFRYPAPRVRGSAALSDVLRGFASRSVVPLAWTVVLCAVLIGALLVHLPLRLDHLGASTVVLGVTFTVVAVVEIVAGPLLGRLHDRVGPRLPVLLCLSAVAGGLLLMLFADRLAAVVLLTAIALPGASLLITPALAGLNELGTRGGLAAAGVFGMSNLLWALGESAGALVAGETLSDPSATAGIVGLLVVVVATIPVVVRSSREPR